MSQVTILDLNRMKRLGQEIVVMPACDFEMAHIIDRAVPWLGTVGAVVYS